MTDILFKALETIKKTYKGKDENGTHIVDRSIVDGLKFDFAMTQISMAIAKGEITEERFIGHISYTPPFADDSELEDYLSTPKPLTGNDKFGIAIGSVLILSLLFTLYKYYIFRLGGTL